MQGCRGRQPWEPSRGQERSCTVRSGCLAPQHPARKRAAISWRQCLRTTVRMFGWSAAHASARPMERWLSLLTVSRVSRLPALRMGPTDL